MFLLGMRVSPAECWVEISWFFICWGGKLKSFSRISN